MTSRQGARRGLAGSITVYALLALLTLWVTPATALAAGRATTVRTASESRPSQPVAYARIGVVRVLATYVGTGSDGVPIPEQVPCASDGVLVGAKGNGLNSYNYVLTSTAALSPITPCAEAQAAFQQLYSAPSSWSLAGIKVLLNVAYTGTGKQQIGSVQYSIDSSQILTNGGTNAPSLLVLPLTVPSGMPDHDLPVLSLPQPSDTPATGTNTTLDLAGPTGDLVARSAIDPTTVLYPVDLPADQIMPPATATATAQPASPTAASGPTAAQLSLGAPVINSNGRLIGVITADSHGKHVLANASTLSGVIAAVTSKSGPLMTSWQTGLAAYYASPAQFSQAQSAFSDLQSHDSDFGGVAPFLAAAQQKSTTIAPLTQAASAGGAPGTPDQNQPGLTSGNMALRIGLIVALVVLIAGVLLALVVRLRDRRAAQAARAIPPDEVGLSLLPRESMYASPADMDLGVGFGPDIEDVPTGQMPAVPPRPQAPASAAVGVDEMPTLAGMPALADVMRAGPTGPRKTTSLVARVAGKTDPGRRRASDPNQDNILAMEGIRLAENRPQPYSFFVVADGMGGHEHGREASAAVIQVYAQIVGEVLGGQQPLDAHTLTHLLRHGIQQAHEELRRRNAANQADMGTTITAALVVDDTAFVANVGDSRTYVMSPDTGLRQITTDHSIVASLAAAGVIRPEEIYTHPRRNQIYRSLGGEQPEIEIDTFTVVLQAGDKLLLCSDGLWEMVRDPQIEHILRATADPQQAVELLVREANANGGEDNISAIVARMVEELPEHAQPGQHILIAPEGLPGRW